MFLALLCFSSGLRFSWKLYLLLFAVGFLGLKEFKGLAVAGFCALVLVWVRSCCCFWGPRQLFRLSGSWFFSYAVMLPGW